MIERNADISTQDIFDLLAGTLTHEDIARRRFMKKQRRKFGRLQITLEAELEKLSTKTLIERLRAKTAMGHGDADYTFEQALIAATGTGFAGNGFAAPPSYRSRWDADEDYKKDWPFDPYFWALKKVLSRRPHVQNKAEGKTARRAAATAHHGPKKTGGRSKLHHPHKFARA